jgi:hypothetical protein
MSFNYPLVINQTHCKNNFTYEVPLQSNIDLSDYSVSVGSGYIYYSWYNISAALNNNSFQLSIPTSNTTTTITITLPDGAYNISTLNNYMQSQLQAQGYYLRYAGDATNVTNGAIRESNIYPCSFQVNPQTYSIQFISIPIPKTAELVAPTYNGYVTAGFTLPTSSNQCTQLILSSNSFGNIIGYAASSTYCTTSSSTTQTIESTLIPNVNPISSMEMRLNCVSNQIAVNSQLLHVFSNKGAKLGELIDISPVQLSFIPCSGQYKSLILQFFDANGKFLNMLDNNILVKLVFKKNNISE